MRKLLFVVMALTLAACSAVAGAAGNQSEIEQNKEKWQNANVSHYRYQLAISCFCIFSQDMPLVIEVQDSKIVSMEYASGKEIDPVNLELFEKYATIDRIFAELEAALNGGAEEVIVQYDPTYGFPTEVTINVAQQVADEEIYLSLSNFEKLP